MKDLLEKNNSIKTLRNGDIVEGKVIAKERSSVFLDLGPTGTGIVYGKEFFDAKMVLDNLKIDDKIFGKVIESENEDGYIEMSVKDADKEIVWKDLREKREKGEILTLKIIGANKGGLTTKVSNLLAFIPVSHLSADHYPRVEQGDPQKIVKELQKLVGIDIELKILDLDPKENKLILSEKFKDDDKIKEIIKNYKVGDAVEGEISGLTDFGAFIKFPSGDENYLEGLIHVSELDWQLISHPSEVIKTGDKVKAQIVNIAENKIFLSLKALKEDPWKDIDKKYKRGDIIEGEVTKFSLFGAFIRLSREFQGLCHISEFASQKKMMEELQLNGKYKFEISIIDSLNHRIGLKSVK